MVSSAPSRLGSWSANWQFIASLFPGSGRDPPRPWKAFSTLLLPSAPKINPTRWKSSSSIDPSPLTDSHSNKALAESSSASAPSILASLSRSRRPWPARRSAASSLFACASPSGLPAGFLPFPRVYSPSLFPSPPAAAVPRGWFEGPLIRCANSAVTSGARSNVPASAHMDRDSARPASRLLHTESRPVLAWDSATARLMPSMPSLPAPRGHHSSPRSRPAVPDRGFPDQPSAEPAGIACRAPAADAQSPLSRFRGFLLSPWGDDPFFARPLPDPAACSRQSHATIRGSPPKQTDARRPPWHSGIPPKSPPPTLSASSSDDSRESRAMYLSPAAPDPWCRDIHTLHQNHLPPTPTAHLYLARCQSSLRADRPPTKYAGLDPIPHTPLATLATSDRKSRERRERGRSPSARA